jgi:hypothetical protein
LEEMKWEVLGLGRGNTKRCPGSFGAGSCRVSRELLQLLAVSTEVVEEVLKELPNEEKY